MLRSNMRLNANEPKLNVLSLIGLTHTCCTKHKWISTEKRNETVLIKSLTAVDSPAEERYRHYQICKSRLPAWARLNSWSVIFL